MAEENKPLQEEKPINENSERRKKRLFWVLIVLDVVALAIIIYEIIAIATR